MSFIEMDFGTGGGAINTESYIFNNNDARYRVDNAKYCVSRFSLAYGSATVDIPLDASADIFPLNVYGEWDGASNMVLRQISLAQYNASSNGSRITVNTVGNHAFSFYKKDNSTVTLVMSQHPSFAILDKDGTLTKL